MDNKILVTNKEIDIKFLKVDNSNLGNKKNKTTYKKQKDSDINPITIFFYTLLGLMLIIIFFIFLGIG